MSLFDVSACRPMGRLPALAMAAVFSLPAWPARADDAHTDLQWLVEAARGHFGELDRTTIITMPLILRHRHGPWTAQVDVPWVRIDSTERFVPGIGSVDTQPRRQRSVVTGLGDVWLKLSYEVAPATAHQTGLDLTLKIKTATGSFERGLGSGGTDVALQVEGLRRAGAASLFGHVGYRRTGDVAGFTPYRDPWYGEVGAMHHVTPACEWGATYTHRQPIGRLGALGEFTALAACRHGAQRWQAYLTRGTQPASADWGIGIGTRHRF